MNPQCEVNIGSYWDNATESIVNWEKRYICPCDATHEYHTDIVSELTKPKPTHILILLCDSHSQIFKQFRGTMKKLDDAQDYNTTQSG